MMLTIAATGSFTQARTVCVATSLHCTCHTSIQLPLHPLPMAPERSSEACTDRVGANVQPSPSVATSPTFIHFFAFMIIPPLRLLALISALQVVREFPWCCISHVFLL